MSALPIVRFRVQTADGLRWWRAECDWTQSAADVLRLSVEAITLTDDVRVTWTVEAVSLVAGLSVESIVSTLRRSLGDVAASRLRDANKLPRVSLPRGAARSVVEVML